MHTEIVESQNRLQRLYSKAERLRKDDSTDAEVVSAFTSYLCVRTYAYLETSVESILRAYVRSVSNDKLIERLVNEQLRRHRNLSRSELLKLIGKFSDEWRVEIREAIKGKLGDSLDGIVNLRNGIAHGSDTSNVSLDSLKNYFADAKAIVELVFHVCKPLNSPFAA
ncbi:MAG: HEPN domain-containing protein [Chloroflexi bacterium]|nr:HEPN domain-containing protein [Chloroflexota bacterium]